MEILYSAICTKCILYHTHKLYILFLLFMEHDIQIMKNISDYNEEQTGPSKLKKAVRHKNVPE
jgi:hypothetical protein